MASVVLGAIGVAVSGANYIKQRKAEKQSARAQKQQNTLQRAEQVNENTRERARSAREERIRRARVIASSQSGGGAGSSGEAGAVSAIGSNFSSVVARQTSRGRTAGFMSQAGQRQADAVSSGRRSQAFTNLVMGGIKTYDDIYNK